MKKITTQIILVCCTYNFTFAQINNKITLPIAEFIQKVKQNHPLAKVANLQVDKANTYLLTAKGAFDPTFEYQIDNKTFDKKNYYFYNSAEVKIPLPIGDIKTGLENNRGQFLSSEITGGRSSYLGLEVPLAKGLLLDKRRATLQQARISINVNTTERNAQINELLLDAYVSYYQWAGAYQLVNIFNKYTQVSKDRLQLIKTLNANGDRALMDTIEAFTQLQNFELLQADATIKFISATMYLNNFVWDGNNIPQSINTNAVPDTILINNDVNNKALLNLIQSSTTQNPLLLQYKYKLQSLEVDRKLKYQNLLPTINLRGNLLNQNYNVIKGLGSTLLENNNKWGLTIKIPLLFREGRGEYQLAKIKIKENTYLQIQKQQEIENKIKDYYNQFILLQTQLSTATQALSNYSKLLSNELLRFNNGESSLFLVNTRENKVLEMQQKIIEIKVKLLKANYNLEWASGTIF